MSVLAKVAKGVLITAAFLSVVHAGTASASDPCSTGEVKEKSVEETVDGWFGDFVVSPMAAFMFYDLVFWDNHYPMGHGFSTRYDGSDRGQRSGCHAGVPGCCT